MTFWSCDVTGIGSGSIDGNDMKNDTIAFLTSK